MLDAEFYTMLLRIIIFLPIILFLIYLLGKLGGNKYQAYQNGKIMNVIERLQLSKDNSILVVKICDKHFIVSSTTGKIEILLELDKEDIIYLDKKNGVESINIKSIYEKLKNKKEDFHE